MPGCLGGHAWLLQGEGGCMVALGSGGGHAWLLCGGACVVAPQGGGIHGCSGACMVFSGGDVVFSGGMHGFFQGRACVGYEIRSMSGR